MCCLLQLHSILPVAKIICPKLGSVTVGICAPLLCELSYIYLIEHLDIYMH